MSQTPLVSVLIPCFNGEKFVREAVESALKQTHSEIEVIVVDDGSTDGSVRILEKLQAEFGERFQFEARPNRGANAARNRAFELSRGEFIQFLDADDVILPQKIEKQLPFLLSGSYDLVFCKGYIFGDGREPRPKKSIIRSPENQDAFVYCLHQGLSTEGPLHRRKLVEKIGGFREGLPRAQEWDFHVRLACAGARIHLLDEWLYWHREHDGPRITRTSRAGDDMLKIALSLSDEIEKHDFKQRIYSMNAPRRAALAGLIFQHSIYAFRNGAEESARQGFRRARELSPSFPINERQWYRGIARLCGPVAAETILKMGRKILARKTMPAVANAAAVSRGEKN